MRLLRAIMVCCLALAVAAPALAGPFEDGRSAARRGDWSQAIGFFTADIKSGTNSPHNLAVVHNNRGNAYLNLGKLDLAIADFNRAIELDPKHANPYYNRSLVWEKKGDKDRAIADIKRYIALKPKDPDGPARLAKLQGSSGTVRKTPPSGRNFSNTNVAPGRSSGEDPHKTSRRLNDQGWDLVKAKKYPQALAKFNRALELDPKFALAYNNRGIVYRRTGKSDLALADYSRAIALGNNKRASAFAHFNRALLYESQKKWSLAIADAKKFLTLMPNDADGPKLLARLERKSGRSASATTPTTRKPPPTTMAAPPTTRPPAKGKSARQLNTDGYRLYKAGKYEQAIALFNQAILLKPDYAVAYHNRGLSYRKWGKYERAIADYNKVISLKPEVAVVYYNRSIAYEKAGKMNQALADINKYIKMAPDDPDGPQRLKYLQKKMGAAQ